VVAGLRDPSAHGLREVGLVRPKGKRDPVRVYEVFDGGAGDEDARRRAAREDFAAGLAAYRAGEFAAARLSFQAVCERDPGDLAARAYLQQAERYEREGAPPGWDGVEVLAEK
jgi:hypothetical protein